MTHVKSENIAVFIVSYLILVIMMGTRKVGLYKIHSPSPRYNIFALGYFPLTSTIPQGKLTEENVSPYLKTRGRIL